VEEFKKNFAIVDSLQPGDLKEGSIVFKQIIRPRHEKVDRIPPVSFSFFNTESGNYKTIKSDPIPIKVLSVRRVTDDDIILNRDNGVNVGREYIKKQRGIYANYAFEDVLISQQQQGVWIVVLILPPLGYLICLLLVSRHRKYSNDESLVRVKSARGIKNKRLKKARSLIGNEGDEFFLELSNALRGYISDKLNLGDGVLTATGVRDLGESKRVSPDLVEPIAECLEEFDRLRFTSRQSSDQGRLEMFEKVNHLIKRLEKAI
ncbi:BatD family protein, partial [bacterium]|nr:BatD family protein [bacterium]